MAPRTGFEPAVFRSTGGCVDRYANEARVRLEGVEPSSDAYQAPALTIVLQPSGNCGNRTHLSRFARPTCHLDSPQLPTLDSNQVQEVQSLSCCRYTSGYQARPVGVEPTAIGFGDRSSTTTSNAWPVRESNPGLQVMSLTWNHSTNRQSLARGSNPRT